MNLVTSYLYLQLRIATILLQAYAESTLPGDVQVTIETCLGRTNCWVVYRVARQATRFGHHPLAAKLFVSLTTKVSNHLPYHNSLKSYA